MKKFTNLGNLKIFSNVSFLYFSWLELKYLEFFLFSFLYSSLSFFYLPICKQWFFRTSFLLKINRYNYFKIDVVKKFSETNALASLFYNSKIIENAIFNCIFPFFRNNYFFKSLSLIEYVICALKIY